MTEEKFCRYCFEDDSVGKLISPCDCRGSAAFIHKRCALKWMLVSEQTACELCNAQFRCKPSQWAAFKKSVKGSKHEALCYAIVFAVFMAPVILFKSIADALRYNSVLTYEQADRLLTGGLFGTYLLLIIFGVLLVAVWVHKCHDDPIADAAVAPDDSLDRPTAEEIENFDVRAIASGESTAMEEGVSEAANSGGVGATNRIVTATIAPSNDGVVVVLGDPRSPGETRRAAALAARSSDHDLPLSTRTSDECSLASSLAITENRPSLTMGASPSVTLAAIAFHHQRDVEGSAIIIQPVGADEGASESPRSETSVSISESLPTHQGEAQGVISPFPSVTSIPIPNADATSLGVPGSSRESVTSHATPSSPSVASHAPPSRQSVTATPTFRSATPSRHPSTSCFSCELDIDDYLVAYSYLRAD